MKKIIFALALLAILIGSAIASFQSTSNFAITLSFVGANQTQADNRRDQALVDYAKMRNLDIYTDSTRTTIDQSKVAPAIRADIKARLKEEVIQYRETQAANAAAASVRGQVNTEIP